MIRRTVKATVSGWRPWAIGAALSLGCAAFLFIRREMAASRALMDDYEAWWQRREKVRANGHQPPASEGDRSDNPQLFV
jgi:hypothetical protein